MHGVDQAENLQVIVVKVVHQAEVSLVYKTYNDTGAVTQTPGRPGLTGTGGVGRDNRFNLTPEEKATLTKDINTSKKFGSYVNTLKMFKPQNIVDSIISKHPIYGQLINKPKQLRKKRANYLDSIVDVLNPNEMTTVDDDDTYAGLTRGINLAQVNMLPQKDFEDLMGYQTNIENKGNDPLLAYQPFDPNAVVDDAPYTNTNTFDYHLGKGGQGIGDDVTLGRYAANGGRISRADGGIMGTRARKAFGGIMDRVTGRKAYGIGSWIKSAVSGVVKATKKVLKSDIGKAALLYAGGTYLGGMKAFGGTGAGFSKFGTRLMQPFSGDAFGSLLSNKFNTIDEGKGIFGRVKGLKDSYDGMGKFGRMATMGGIGLGLSMIPGLNKPKPNEDSYADRGGSLIDPITGLPAKPAEMRSSLNDALANANGDPDKIKQIQDAYAFLPPDERLGTYSPYRTYGVKDGGRIGFNSGGGFSKNDLYLLKKFKYDPKKVATHKDGGKDLINSLKTVGFNMGGRIGKAEGGLMDLGGMEKDYRAEGGFVPIGAKEKADDVPARLSVNEFVFTADAVRGAGGGDIDQGAEIMENMMNNLEKGGTVSEESQGNAGAQQMFNTSERLGEVI